MPSNDVVRGNIQYSQVLSISLSPTSVPNGSGNEQTFTVQGLNVGDFVNVTKPTSQAGLSIANARVSAANTLAIAFANATSATITPTAAESYLVMVDRPLGTLLSSF